MNNIYQIYKEILLIDSNFNNIYLNENVKRYIFSFLIDDYKKIINENFINSKIHKSIIYSNFIGAPLTIHIDEVPYPKFITINQLKDIVDKKIKNKNLYFANYCCSNTGLFYENIDNYISKLFNFK